jgi:hypothetical protein
VRVSPDGLYLAVQKQDPGNSLVLALMPVQGGEARELAPVNVSPPYPSLLFTGWTPDGKGLLALKMSTNTELNECWFLPVTGDRPRKLEIGLLNYDPQAGVIAVHPDGRQIAYVAGGRKVEVWVLENFLPTK